MHVKYITILIVFVFFSAAFLPGCSSHVLKDQQELAGKAPDTKINQNPGELSDKELFDAALSFLRNDANEPNDSEAKIRLEQLVQKYPKSKWTTGSQALIESLDRIASLQAQLKLEKQKAQADYLKFMKEIDVLKINGRHVDEKYAAEITRLQQENEKLKNDLQQLKKLEVELEKREKMLR